MWNWFKKKKTCVHCNKNNTKRDFENQPTCGVIAKTLDWGDWLLGSSSTQFHFIDLLELLSTF